MRCIPTYNPVVGPINGMEGDRLTRDKLMTLEISYLTLQFPHLERVFFVAT